MASLDDVWAKMKEKAAEYARNGVVPTYRDAETVVRSLFHAAHLDRRPSAEVIDFYARELLALTQDESDKDCV